MFRILVCRISHSLGNSILVTPLIREIESSYPGAEIHVLTRSPVADALFGSFASVGAIMRLPAWGFGHPWHYLGVLRRLRRERYDLVIDPSPGSQTDRVLALFARSRFQLGFCGKRKAGSISHPVVVPTEVRHIGQMPVFLLRTALGKPASGSWPAIDLALTAAEKECGAATLSRVTGLAPGLKRVIGIFADASGPKLLGGPWWKRFLDTLETLLADCSFIEIVPMSGVSLLDLRYRAFYSRDIRKLAGVLSALAFHVSADCGVMHLASASGTGTIGLFSITDAAEWGPYGARDRAIVTLELTPEQVAQQVADQIR